MASTYSILKSIQRISKSMHKCSRFIALPELQMSMKQEVEVVQDCMDDAVEDAREQKNELVEKVLNKVGLDIDSKLLEAPKEKNDAQVVEGVEDKLENRRNKLKS